MKIRSSVPIYENVKNNSDFSVSMKWYRVRCSVICLPSPLLLLPSIYETFPLPSGSSLAIVFRKFSTLQFSRNVYLDGFLSLMDITLNGRPFFRMKTCRWKGLQWTINTASLFKKDNRRERRATNIMYKRILYQFRCSAYATYINNFNWILIGKLIPWKADILIWRLSIYSLYLY